MILPIFKDRIPYNFELEHSGAIYVFELHYNTGYNFFTMDLYKEDEILAHGEKLVYGQELFKSLNLDELPKITPIDKSGKEQIITYDNLGVTVLLEVDYYAI